MTFAGVTDGGSTVNNRFGAVRDAAGDRMTGGDDEDGGESSSVSDQLSGPNNVSSPSVGKVISAKPEMPDIGQDVVDRASEMASSMSLEEQADDDSDDETDISRIEARSQSSGTSGGESSGPSVSGVGFGGVVAVVGVVGLGLTLLLGGDS